MHKILCHRQRQMNKFSTLKMCSIWAAAQQESAGAVQGNIQPCRLNGWHEALNLVYQYHKVSQQVNPDWVGKGDKEDTTHHFQFLRKVYSIVCDKD